MSRNSFEPHFKISEYIRGIEAEQQNSNGMSSDQLAMVYESFSYSWPLFEVIYQEDQTMTFAKMFETIVIKMS